MSGTMAGLTNLLIGGAIFSVLIGLGLLLGWHWLQKSGGKKGV